MEYYEKVSEISVPAPDNRELSEEGKEYLHKEMSAIEEMITRMVLMPPLYRMVEWIKIQQKLSEIIRDAQQYVVSVD